MCSCLTRVFCFPCKAIVKKCCCCCRGGSKAEESGENGAVAPCVIEMDAKRVPLIEVDAMAEVVVDNTEARLHSLETQTTLNARNVALVLPRVEAVEQKVLKENTKERPSVEIAKETFDSLFITPNTSYMYDNTNYRTLKDVFADRDKLLKHRQWDKY